VRRCTRTSHSFRKMATRASIALGCVKGMSRRFLTLKPDPMAIDALFNGYTCDGGFATATIADARFAFPLGEDGRDVSLAPLLCAGLIGWRSLVIAGKGKTLGLYGFGAPAHIVAQVPSGKGD
jgi:hypothetical protein